MTFFSVNSIFKVFVVLALLYNDFIMKINTFVTRLYIISKKCHLPLSMSDIPYYVNFLKSKKFAFNKKLVWMVLVSDVVKTTEIKIKLVVSRHNPLINPLTLAMTKVHVTLVSFSREYS